MFPPTIWRGGSDDAMSWGCPIVSPEVELPLESVVCPPQAAAADPLDVESEPEDDEPDELKEVEKEEPPNEDGCENEFWPLPKPDDAPADTGLPKFGAAAWEPREAFRQRIFKLPINVPPGPR